MLKKYSMVIHNMNNSSYNEPPRFSPHYKERRPDEE